jgi:HD-GYP domain-containing protein (c-di-GMP phosphodiesterase class II)
MNSGFQYDDGSGHDLEAPAENLSDHPAMAQFSRRFRYIAASKQSENELRQSFEKLQRTLEGMVVVLAAMVEKREPFIAGHHQRVTRLACAIAEEMGLNEERIEGIRMTGAVHDIGRIDVPAEILNKPGQLSEIELALVKAHPQAGYDLLRTVEFPWPVAPILLQHHERMDGSGYPKGLAGENILLEARILGIADVVEAMSSPRSYRPALGINKALKEIVQYRGILYDPGVVDACFVLFAEKGFTFEEDSRHTQIHS